MMCRKFGCSGVRECFAHYTAKWCRYVIEFFADVLFALVCRFQTSGCLPDVTNPVLLDGAVALAEKIRNREVTSVSVVQAYIKRVELVNPTLRCITDTRFDAALRAAKEVDALLDGPDVDLQQLRRDKPFLGVPFTVKEPIKLKDCTNSAGLYLLRDQKADRHGEAVLAMMDVGAIPIATTNIPEMCMWWDTENTIVGVTRNPHDLRYSAGGSSGGEASAIAACCSPMGLGSDLGGSIRIPCLFNGICGHKPTPGFVPNGGHSPELTGQMSEFFVIGPMARYAEDVREMMKALTKRSEGLNLDRSVDMKKLRFFYLETTGDPLIHSVDKDMLQTLHKVVLHLKSAYGVSTEKVVLPHLRYAFLMWGHEIAKHTIGNEDLILKNYLDTQEGEVRWWAEWAKLLTRRSHHTYPLLFHASLQGLMFANVEKPFGKFLDAECDALREEVESLLRDDGVLIFPTFPHTALPHKKSYFYFASLGHSGIVNVLKLPATHLPVGFSQNGLPLGVTIIAGRNQDALTLEVACALDKTLGGYVPPCTVAFSGKGKYLASETNGVVRRSINGKY